MNIRKLGAHVPWAQVAESLDQVLDLDLIPEIAIKGPDLDTLDGELVRLTGDSLLSAGVRPSIHAPFFDLNPGALDPLIRDVTYRRLQQTMDFAARLNAHLMVIHPGVDKWRYPNLEHAWQAQATTFFQNLIDLAERCDCRLALENIYEETPSILVSLVETIDSKWFGHCYDVGHWKLFGKRPMEEWLEALGARLFHLHLHDNFGNADEHLPVGEGSIDFMPLKEHLFRTGLQPSMTLEAHSVDHLRRSLLNVHALV